MTSSLCFVVFLVTAAGNPFVGTWKPVLAEDESIQQQSIIRFAPADGELGVTYADEAGVVFSAHFDGKGYAGVRDSAVTFELKSERDRDYAVIASKSSRMISSESLKVSEDGNELLRVLTTYDPDGEARTEAFQYARMAESADTPRFDPTLPLYGRWSRLSSSDASILRPETITITEDPAGLRLKSGAQDLILRSDKKQATVSKQATRDLTISRQSFSTDSELHFALYSNGSAVATGVFTLDAERQTLTLTIVNSKERRTITQAYTRQR